MAKRHFNRVGDLESLFLRLEELVLANSGEDEFEEIFKLLIAKLWDERNGGQRFRAHPTEAETMRAVEQLLDEADAGWPGILETRQPALTAEHLQVCVDALARHKVLDHSFEVLDGFFEFLVAKAAKGAKGQFFTPRYVAELCVRLLRPTAQDTILDPACGSGGFLIHALNYVRSTGALPTEGELRAFCETKLFGFDVDGRAIRVAKALMLMAGGRNANIVRLNSLLRPEMMGLFPLAGEKSALTIEDVCRGRLRKHKGFDLILTNPPFAGEVRERQILDGYSLSRGKPSIERDILFLERCVQLLKPGGRMAIVLPHNKFAADSFSYVREWLLRTTRVLAVIGLGRNTFLPHTHQKASVLLVERQEPGIRMPDYPIFFSVSERDGKNSKGQSAVRNAAAENVWGRIDHDFEEIVKGYEEFCVLGQR